MSSTQVPTQAPDYNFPIFNQGVQTLFNTFNLLGNSQTNTQNNYRINSLGQNLKT